MSGRSLNKGDPNCGIEQDTASKAFPFGLILGISCRTLPRIVYGVISRNFVCIWEEYLGKKAGPGVFPRLGMPSRADALFT